MKNNLITLWKEFNKYINIELELYKLTAVEKVSLLLSSIATYIIIILLLCIALIFFTLTLSEFYRLLLDNQLLAYLFSGLSVVLLLALILILKKYIIINPFVKLISKLFLKPIKNNNNE